MLVLHCSNACMHAHKHTHFIDIYTFILNVALKAGNYKQCMFLYIYIVFCVRLCVCVSVSVGSVPVYVMCVIFTNTCIKGISRKASRGLANNMRRHKCEPLLSMCSKLWKITQMLTAIRLEI
jgi:hypothetical protein